MSVIGNQVEDYTTHNCLEFHQDADYARILNIRRSVSVILHTLLDVAICWKVNIQIDRGSDSTDGEIRCTHKAVKKTKFICKYMEALSFQTGSPKLHRKGNTSCIYVVEAKIVTPSVKHVVIPICFLLKEFGNGFSIPKYDKSSLLLADMCTKPCSGKIISQSTK